MSGWRTNSPDWRDSMRRVETETRGVTQRGRLEVVDSRDDQPVWTFFLDGGGEGDFFGAERWRFLDE